MTVLSSYLTNVNKTNSSITNSTLGNNNTVINYICNYANSTNSSFTSQTVAGVVTNITTSNQTIINTTIATVVSNVTTNVQSSTYYNTYATDLVCWTGTYFVHGAFAVIGGLILISTSFLIVLTYYETKVTKNNITAKTNSNADFLMLITKIVSVLFAYALNSYDTQWLLISIYFVLSTLLVSIYISERPYYNVIIMRVYLVCITCYWWSTAVLVIAKILQDTSFDLCIAMFFIGLPIIIFYVLANDSDAIKYLMTNSNKFTRGEDYQRHIRYFLELIDTKDTERQSRALIKGYIFTFEETCLIQDCALKKYIYSIDNNMETNVFLYQHAEGLFTSGIAKFPKCVSLRIAYAFFLLEKMNKKQQATLELRNIEKYNPNFSEQFIIYRYKKLLEEQSSENGESDENLDVVSNLAYKNYLNQFKNCISKAAVLYMDFWSLLLNPNQDSQEDLSKLNDYGSKINQLIEEINNHLEKMQKLKQNDQEVIRLYSDFLNDIMNDKDKANTFKSRLNEIETVKHTYDEVNMLNVDLNALKNSDEYQFIVVSAAPEKFGIIANISLGVCSMFGYSRAELIGKNMEILMPEIYHKLHKTILQEKISEYNKNIMTNINKSYKPVYKEVQSFGKNKSRYLIPFNFKVGLVSSAENNDCFFVAKMGQDNFNLESNSNTCFILTNNQFIIQNFTANSLNILGMNSASINNGNMEIVRFIKEFMSEYAKHDYDDKTVDQILALKRQIINTNFKTAQKITWRKAEEIDQSTIFHKPLDTNKDLITTPGFNKPTNKFIIQSENTTIEENFMLSIQIINMGLKTEGYIFRFDQMKINLSSNNINNKFTKEPPKKDRTTITDTVTSQEDFTSEVAQTETDMKIDKLFIPAATSEFYLDPKKMSYLVNPKNVDNLKDLIKEEAKIKFQNLNNVVNEESILTSEYDSASSSNIDSNAESSMSMERKMTLSRRRPQEGYYMVKTENIKFLIYDFKKHSLIEEKDDFWKKSQMEIKKNEDHKRRDREDKTLGLDDSPANIEKLEEANINMNTKEEILIKQIEYALSKEEDQSSITSLRWKSFIIVLIILGGFAGFLAILITNVSNTLTNLNLIYSSRQIMTASIIASNFVREMTLLNNPLYTNYYTNKPNYVTNITGEMLNLFNTIHDINYNITISVFGLSNTNNYLLNNQTLNISILEDDLTTKPISLVLSSAVVEVNTALYHIVYTDLSTLYASNKDIFFFLYNIDNQLIISLQTQMNIFMSQLQINSNLLQNIYMYFFIGITAFCFISYFFIADAYETVSIRKESYLEVFFEIGSSTIKASLEKCEQFTKKLQAENNNELISNLDEAEMAQDTSVLTPQKSGTAKSFNKKRKNRNSREEKITKFKFCIIFIFIAVASFLIYWFAAAYLDNLQDYISAYYSIHQIETENINVLNLLRDYMFDPTTILQNVTASSLVTNYIQNFYQNKLADITVSIFLFILFRNLMTFPQFYLMIMTISLPLYIQEMYVIIQVTSFQLI